MTATSPTTAFLDELAWRGLLFQQTEGAAAALAAGSVSGYCGFDPTADSLHVGNLVPVMGLVHLQRAGHRPVALVGGGTGMIGDPSGKSTERQLNSREVVEENARRIRAQLGRFLEFAGPNAAVMRDNAEWLLSLGAVEFMRDVGKHFSVNFMLAKESVRSRMETGISYTEFSYMLLQAYDFLELNRRDGVTLQIGGSDQWGNITAGTELVRRVEGRDAHGVTLPLVTTAAGTKFGKTEGGAVWLDPEKTTPYQFYQFWINVDDRDVSRYLRFFTLLPREEIEALERAAADRPQQREAQQALARDVTARVHGEAAVQTVEEISALLFRKGDPRALSVAALESLEREIPFAVVKLGSSPEAQIEQLVGVPGIDVLELFVAAGLCASRGEAKRLLAQGGMTINGRRLAAGEHALADPEFLADKRLLLRKGARDYALVRVE
ncbi:MAG TPA: tyrosine--tRNA ligase [Gemmatimonadaceae bacterium]|nr:tyrosine--tRNA ligase [Gemmatimonadaceae bacterium]